MKGAGSEPAADQVLSFNRKIDRDREGGGAFDLETSRYNVRLKLNIRLKFSVSLLLRHHYLPG